MPIGGINSQMVVGKKTASTFMEEMISSGATGYAALRNTLSANGRDK